MSCGFSFPYFEYYELPKVGVVVVIGKAGHGMNSNRKQLAVIPMYIAMDIHNSFS